MKDGKAKFERRLYMQYDFVDPDDYRQFQEDLRDRDLLDTFNTEIIKTKGSGPFGDAGNQDLKIWRTKDEEQICTLSFFANHAKGLHREYPLRWFQPTFKTPADRTVKLEFTQQNKSQQNKPSVYSASPPKPGLMAKARTWSLGNKGM
jgi:hypothetical protein